MSTHMIAENGEDIVEVPKPTTDLAQILLRRFLIKNPDLLTQEQSTWLYCEMIATIEAARGHSKWGVRWLGDDDRVTEYPTRENAERAANWSSSCRVAMRYATDWIDVED